MDHNASKIKYRNLIIKTKNKALREVVACDQFLDDLQCSCEHLIIINGHDKDKYTNENVYRECLYCGKTDFLNKELEMYPSISAFDYKEELCGIGDKQEDRDIRIILLRDMYLSLASNSNSKMDTINSLIEHIENYDFDYEVKQEKKLGERS